MAWHSRLPLKFGLQDFRLHFKTTKNTTPLKIWHLACKFTQNTQNLRKFSYTKILSGQPLVLLYYKPNRPLLFHFIVMNGGLSFPRIPFFPNFNPTNDWRWRERRKPDGRYGDDKFMCNLNTKLNILLKDIYRIHDKCSGWCNDARHHEIVIGIHGVPTSAMTTWSVASTSRTTRITRWQW